MHVATLAGRVLSCAVCLFLVGHAWGQAPAVPAIPYPAKTVRIINPYATGGSAGGLARLVAQKLSQEWGQAVIVEDRPGGNQIIGTDAVAKAPADGYTVLWQAASHVINPHLFPAPYDAIRDFAAVGTFASTEFLLVAHPSVAANNLRELVAYAKANPGVLNYAGTGNSGPSYLAGELFQARTGVKIQHVGYKGVAPAITDLIGGQVQLAFQTPAAALQYIKAGKLKAIAVSGRSRLAALPQVPTFTEAGLADFDMTFWFGALMPAGTPEPVIRKFSAAMAAAAKSSDVEQALAAQGLRPFATTPAHFSALLKTDFERYGKLIQSAGIKVD